ncbi:hypothetical protein QJS66_23095 [Kocuria rhizophila]|nr:hypothetical protein QJS66_23095 [Kocuria rhizophila]
MIVAQRRPPGPGARGRLPPRPGTEFVDRGLAAAWDAGHHPRRA